MSHSHSKSLSSCDSLFHAQFNYEYASPEMTEPSLNSEDIARLSEKVKYTENVPLYYLVMLVGTLDVDPLLTTIKKSFFNPLLFI